MTNKGYILLLITYGLNVGVFYAISTLLNSTILMHFKVNSKYTRAHEIFQIPTGIGGLIDMLKNYFRRGLMSFGSKLEVQHVLKVSIFQLKILTLKWHKITKIRSLLQ